MPEYDPLSGGIKVCWGLYGWLLAKGQVVYANAQFANLDFVAIYPEIYHGNPAGAGTVVRYILNKPGTMGQRNKDGGFTPGPTVFDPADKLYYFSRLFGEARDENHYMFLPVINTHLFRDYSKKRTKKAVYFGKGGAGLGLHPEDCVVIDRKIAGDQQGLADLLNICEVLYCYDSVTAMTEISRLCGCRVVIFPSTYRKAEFKKYEPGMEGISWGKDEGIKLNTGRFRAHYLDMVWAFSKKLDSFIDETQK